LHPSIRIAIMFRIVSLFCSSAVDATGKKDKRPLGELSIYIPYPVVKQYKNDGTGV